MPTTPTATPLHYNRLKAALAAGEGPKVGLWLSLGSPTAAEVAAQAGFHWLLVDTEHSPNDLQEVLDQLRAIAAFNAAPVVRPATNDPVLIKRLLDIGAQSLIVPFVETAAEAKAAVSATRYPPDGVRGYSGSTRANRYGRHRAYAAESGEQIMLFVQVESRRALDNIEAIAAVEGVDGLFFGAADLAVDLGCGGDVSNPRVWDAICQGLGRMNSAKSLGILLGQDADINKALSLGFSFVAVGSDLRLLVAACDRLSSAWIEQPWAQA